MQAIGRTRAGSWAVLLALLVVGFDASARPPLRLVARTGDPAPAAGPFAEFGTFSAPLIDPFGRVSFQATLQGALVSGGGDGVYGESATFEVRHRAREGLPAPGLGDDVYTGFSDLVMGDDATVYFRAGLAEGAHGSGIFASGDAGAALVVVTDAQAPELAAGVDIDGFVGPLATSGGTLAFAVDLTEPGAYSEGAIYTYTYPGAPALVTVAGDPAPETIFSFLRFLSAALPSPDRIGVDATTDGPSSGIWTLGPSGGDALARSGQPAPGLSGVALASFSAPTFNAAGDVSFASSLTGTGVDSENDTALLLGDAEGLVLLAREGELGPGTTDAPFFSFPKHAIDDRGRVLFTSKLEGLVLGSSIWRGTAAQVELLVREGDPAPGTSAEFSEPITVTAFEPLAVAADGDFAFAATLFGAGVNPSNDSGVWRSVRDELELVIREGDSIELAPGLFETVVGVSLLPSSRAASGGATAMNRRGALALRLVVTSGEAIVVAAPEPGAASLALVALGATTLRRATRRHC